MILRPSAKLMAAVCDDAVRIFEDHLKDRPLTDIYASEAFRRLRERVRREFPTAADHAILEVVLAEYSERLKNI